MVFLYKSRPGTDIKRNKFLFTKTYPYKKKNKVGYDLNYNATTAEENHQKTNLIYSQARSSAVRHLVYFDNRYDNHSADGIFDIAALTVRFIEKLSFSRLSVR